MNEFSDELLDPKNIHQLNRLVALGKIDASKVIEKHKELEPKLYIGESKLHNRGVFSSTQIRDRQVIENVSIIKLEFRSKYHKDQTIVNYCYAFPEMSEESLSHGYQLFIFTGYGMLYNHQDSKNSNAEWAWDLTNYAAKLIAKKNIQPDQEITIDYGEGYWNR